MTQTWEQWEGETLAGAYGLEQWLGSEASGAFFQTTHGQARDRAVLKLTQTDRSTADAQLAVWQRAAGLRHPHLMAILDCGRVDTADESLLFTVFEAPEDSLTAAIENGAISEQEALDIFAAGIDALAWLHERGWAHTSIDAEHVVAVGDRIKLSSDTLREVDPGDGAQSHDVWALGALTYELVSGRRIEPGRLVNVSGISDPLRTMIQLSTEPDARERWTAAQLAHSLNPAPAVEEPPSIVAQPETAVSTDSAVKDEPMESANDVPVSEPLALASGSPANPPDEFVEAPALQEPFPAAPAEPAPLPEVEPELSPRPPVIRVHEPFSIVEPKEPAAPEALPTPDPIFSRYVPMAAVGAVALLAIVFVVAHRGATPPPAVAIVPPPVSEPAAPVVPVNVPQASPQTWRVISYTYFRQQDAERRAELINNKYRDIHAEVFTLSTKPPSYLISLGAHLTRDDAEALRHRALARGLPRDTFVRNFGQ